MTSASRPLSVSLLESSINDPELLAQVTAVARWATPPTRWSGGRAGWLELPLERGGEVGRGLKFKGLGSPPGPTSAARPPDGGLYDRWPGQAIDPHFGIGADGEFCLLDGDPAPVGGLIEASARREQACAADLIAAGAPAVQPVAAYRYDDLSFEHGGEVHPLAVSITASPLADDHRCSILLPGAAPIGSEGDRMAEIVRLAKALGGPDAASDSPVDSLRLLGRAYKAFGRSLRAFSAAGWYRYSGHPGNITIDDAGRAVLVDLDSCRPAAAVTATVASLEAVRDAMSALYNLSCSFYSSTSLGSLDDETLIDHQPFEAFLDGWSPSSGGANRTDGDAIAHYVIASRRQLRHFGAFLDAGSPAADHLYRFVRHDRDLTFCWLFRLLYRRHIANPGHMTVAYPLAELDDRLLRFAGRPRFEALMELERE